MRFKRLDLNLLVALDILLEECSVTRAASRLHLSQSATSGTMARLREYFADELLVPVGRQMVRTPLGASLCEPVRAVLLKIQSTIETKPGFDPLTSTRHFRIIASDYPVTVLLTECARRLAERAPHVTLEVIAPDDTMQELVARAEVDLVIIPEKYLIEEHPSEVLFEDTHVCAVWAGNESVGKGLTLAQYLAAGHVATNFGRRRGPSIDELYLQHSGYARRIEVTTNSFNTVPQYLIGTGRIATMHKRLAEVFTGFYPLRLLPSPIPIPVLVETMQWHRSLEFDLAHLWLRALLREVIQGSP
ncbi:LysR family transcriptional regulator [Oxalobacteraceae bacterium]|nr:LysR family transcriptional regulator [Oxalobacteraceae bacterium]